MSLLVTKYDELGEQRLASNRIVKRQRTAALQNLAKVAAGSQSRRRFGVRPPSAALDSSYADLDERIDSLN